MKFMKQHLKDRHVDLNIHKVWIDEDSATFPIYNISGKMVGYQRYKPLADKKQKNAKEGRYFTYSLKDTRGVWGLESWKFSNILFLTEGIFDAARLTERGYSAIAVMSNDPKHIQQWLFMIGQTRPIVSICDAGKAGIKLAKYGHQHHVMPEEYDLGDCPESYLETLIEKYGDL